MRASLSPLLLWSFAFLPGPALTQPAPITRPAPPLQPQAVGPQHEIIIYRDRNFDGPAVAIPQDEPNLRLVWTVSSVRVRGGTWQLCERPNYHGTCLTVSASKSNLNRLRVQSARMIRAAWRSLGGVNINRVIRDNRTIRVQGSPRVWEVRLCAEGSRMRLYGARARFSNARFQTLDIPRNIESGRCTGPMSLTSAPRDLSSVEVTATSLGITRGRIRLEAR